MALKFKVTITNGVMHMTDEVRARMRQATGQAKDGCYDLLLREEMKWDTDAMRKYFHGPVLKFIVEQFKVLGCMYSKNEVKEYLKQNFGPQRDHAPTGHRGIKLIIVPKSTAEYDFKTYTQFLNDINAWCIECFGCELPTAEEIE